MQQHYMQNIINTHEDHPTTSKHNQSPRLTRLITYSDLEFHSSLKHRSQLKFPDFSIIPRYFLLLWHIVSTLLSSLQYRLELMFRILQSVQYIIQESCNFLRQGSVYANINF